MKILKIIASKKRELMDDKKKNKIVLKAQK